MALMTRSYFRDLITGPDVQPLIPELARFSPEEPAAYASVICARLLARSFAAPGDVRIAPWVRRVAGRLPPEPLEALIRATLGGDGELERIPPEQILGLQIYIIRALVRTAGMRAGDVDDLLASAEPLVREAARHIHDRIT